MPNWCTNHLQVWGPINDVTAFRQKARGHSPWETHDSTASADPLNVHSLVPVPYDILRAGYDDAGYTWELAYSGCKWGACEAELLDAWDGHLMYRFDTAWSPPLEFLKQVARQWSTLTFSLAYEEPGLAFKGMAQAHGQQMEDHCVTC